MLQMSGTCSSVTIWPMCREVNGLDPWLFLQIIFPYSNNDEMELYVKGTGGSIAHSESPRHGQIPILHRSNLIRSIKLHAEVKRFPLPASPAIQPALINVPTDWINTSEDACLEELGEDVHP